MTDKLRQDVEDLMLIPGLSGHEDRVRRRIASRLEALGLTHRTDRLGNLITTLPGTGPSVMLFAHMDQLGFIVRKVFDTGEIAVERLGGVPERTLLSQQVVLSGTSGDIPGIIGALSHHVTPQADKSHVPATAELRITTGHNSRQEVEAAGITIGTPVTYAPNVFPMGPHQIAGTSVDDRAGCAILLHVAEALQNRTSGPTLHLVWTVQEEFNLRGAQPVAQTLLPDIAIQLDLMVATDTPDTDHLGDMALGGGPGMSLYSFHGRGTLNGVIPHPGLVALMETTAKMQNLPLQRSAKVGVLTDLSYVQLTGEGVAAIDMGFPMRHSHSSLEVCDIRDLDMLRLLLIAAIQTITPDFALNRD
jgi:putative aminopeptidase FrvX